MAHELDGTRMRVVSPTECERLLGFEPGWTNPGDKASPGTGYQRRNAIGNAFAVPVVTRLLLALMMVARGEGLSAFPLGQIGTSQLPTATMCWTTFLQRPLS